MRALFLVTYTADCEKDWRSWIAAGHECHVEVYDDRPHSAHVELVGLARARQPDVIVFVGALEQYHGRPVPQPDIFRRLREVAPTIHLCHDAADPPWWPMLQEYERQECFNLQVNIDGSFDTPLAKSPTGLTKLTPTDPGFFRGHAWDARATHLGMCGATGHGARAAVVHELAVRDLLTHRHGVSFAEMGAFLGGCKIVLNVAVTGSGERTHVKGRVVETGWAGACLLEYANPWTQQWFDPNDFMTYLTPDQARDLVAWARDNDQEVARKALRFHQAVARDHHPRVFWRDVLEKAGALCLTN